ncbi:indole-diterpene biosynthesis protein-like protein PaxU [Aaosphaeria arxii CBS 175.79]|uniref:Indole-diterpene biosynthesis protein-like protein PaxU n=1 Tax=Aaosphaeria arxii CBS 175.79 TaxID=1450172 RepID=A0A6A5XQS1_9PLEO|nr:indole-diterpene biosynthesis protein-like protein PaxU [Aaosphaeria arxii CBS 175.79]KAF2015246.1 indole-diterpene biosynthesis protein-like protein PaxU [Aaosphaeria arxii CBS 175.79]
MARPGAELATTVAKPLSDFQKIGYNTYIWTPSTYDPARGPLILLFSWNAGAAKHIAKYTFSYQKLFPSSRILLIRCYTPDMFKSEATYRDRLTPAMDTVKEHITNGGHVLTHSFSNGGGNQLVEFSKAWVKRESTVLPMRALVLDSSPGKGGWIRSHAAIVASMPKGFFWQLFGGAITHLMLAMIFVFNVVTMRENKMIVMCREMNDPRYFDLRTPRVYIYSKADLMVAHDEVEEHASDSAAKGWVVTKVRFESSAHAGHVREDEQKYWNAIRGAYDKQS